MKSNILLRAEQMFSDQVFRREILLGREQGVVSFCFDDAPKSSCVAGREALEALGCHGTWYIAGGLTDKLEYERMCHSVEDVMGLVQAGHHIGCHSYSHTPWADLTGEMMEEEVRLNADFFLKMGLPSSGLDFSFPLGSFNYMAKRVAAKHFRSTRVIGGGIQEGYADLNALKAISLYQHTQSLEQIALLIKAASIKCGWLIFYTHDVDPNPSTWGCKQELLTFAIRSAQESGCKVLSVDEAIRYWSSEL